MKNGNTLRFATQNLQIGQLGRNEHAGILVCSIKSWMLPYLIANTLR